MKGAGEKEIETDRRIAEKKNFATEVEVERKSTSKTR
jgi:transcription termination factor Rho